MALLQVTDVSASFGGLLALDRVTIDVPEGAITGLIGPNGAGKTTLFNVVCGLQSTTTGKVVLDGRNISRMKTHRRARLGLARTFQRLEVFGSMSARDNVRTAAEIHSSWAPSAADADRRADELIERVGLGAVAYQKVDTLSTGLARLVELARALATQPRVLLLDEPSSGLDEAESRLFGQLVLELAASGLGVLLVEHDVGLVMSVCSQIHVLDFGRVIASGAPDAIQAHPDVQAAYLGKETPQRA